MGNSVPGGWFIGRPANKADEQKQAAANTQTSRGFFVGALENIRPQAVTTTTATEQPQPAGELRRSRSFMDWYSCGSNSSGSSTEENRVLLTELNAHNMENKRNRRNDNPWKLPFELIKQITNDFSEELGRGAFGQVFKGVLEDGEEVAVKMLHFMGNINDQQFENEFEILKRLEHPNIVQLVAFCDEAQEVCVEYNGKLTVCQRIHRALCLEYMPNGSLGKLLHGENFDKNWPIRYSIIKGICEGLEYLQEGLEFPIFHLDLKPDNILLNEEMLPKISDFGLSRLIGEENTKKTLTPLGTIGYIPPEFINYQVISKEYDIYSIGVIITKIITGITGYSDVANMGAEEFVEHVYEKWKKSLQEIPRQYASLEVDCKQVKRCIEVARSCMENDRHKRPKIKDIVSQLDEIDMENIELGPLPPSKVDLPWMIHPEYLQLQSKTIPIMEKDDRLSKILAYAMELKRKRMTAAVGAFLCDGCKEPGYGPRYASNCGDGGHTFDLHTRCALAGDQNHTPVLLPLFGYGKQFEFRFLHEPPPLWVVQEVGRSRTRVCDACGEPTRGFVYHCTEQDVDLHPCCASLPDRIIQDGRAFDLHRRASRPCPLCPDDEGQRRWFWAYRCYVDGEAVAVDLHVACLKETARRSWETNYRNRPDVGDGGLNVDGMLENKFGEIAGTVASFITALVFGNLIVKL